MTTSDVEEAIRKFRIANNHGPTFEELLVAVASLTNCLADEADLQDELNKLQAVGQVRQVKGRFMV